MKPDSSKYNPDPNYLRDLLSRTCDPETGKPYSQRKAARVMGISERVIRYYLVDVNHESYRSAPYPIQFLLECLAKDNNKTR